MTDAHSEIDPITDLDLNKSGTSKDSVSKLITHALQSFFSAFSGTVDTNRLGMTLSTEIDMPINALANS